MNPIAARLAAELAAARLAVNDWHACATNEELDRWRRAQARLIDAAQAVAGARPFMDMSVDNPVDTYTPILWAVLSEEARYQEYLRVRDADEANGRLIAELLAALKGAVETIAVWHSFGHADIVAWDIYREHAPEMQAINAAIAKAEGR